MAYLYTRNREHRTHKLNKNEIIIIIFIIV